MTALLEQATINEHRNTIVHHPLMGSTGHAAPRAVAVTTREPAQARLMKMILVVS